MKITGKQLFYLSLLAYVLTLFNTALFPFFAIRPFLPLLLLILYTFPQLRSMQIAAFYGLSLDLVCFETPFGTYCVIFTIVMGLLYGQKRTFFEDHPTTIPILSFEFSILLSVVEFGMFTLVGKGFSLSWSWAILDLGVYGLLDALFAFVWIRLVVPRLIGVSLQVEEHDLPVRPI
jgi:rod shape-determining protein MreD